MQIKEVEQIVAFIPLDRADLGPCVQLYFTDGQTAVEPVALRSFVRRLARIYLLNLPQMRKRLGAVCGCKNLVPLALTPALLFVPLKTRVPLVRGDSAYGYFRFRSLLAVAPAPAATALELAGGHQLTIRQSYRIVCQRLRRAGVLERYLFRQFYLTEQYTGHNLPFLSKNEHKVQLSKGALP